MVSRIPSRDDLGICGVDHLIIILGIGKEMSATNLPTDRSTDTQQPTTLDKTDRFLAVNVVDDDDNDDGRDGLSSRV